MTLSKRKTRKKASNPSGIASKETGVRRQAWLPFLFWTWTDLVVEEERAARERR